METLRVDCNDCAVRGSGCSDCVISVLLGVPDAGPAAMELGADEQEALAALAGSGLVPPLRLVRAVEPARGEPVWRDARFAE